MLDDSDHDHQACRSRAVTRAEERCRDEGLRLTEQRRQVLEAMMDPDLRRFYGAMRDGSA